MPGLVPGIHAFRLAASKSWMAGTSPAMTNGEVMRTLVRSATALAFAVLIALPAAAPAQTWPQRTVRIILPLPPGAGTDVSGRLYAERLAKRWGQPVVVENRQGADGIPAVTSFLAARDNHTFLLSFAGVITINPLIHEKLPYDPARDLVPIGTMVDNFLGVLATAKLDVASLADLIKAARAQPGKLNWAATPGLPHYILLALQKSAALDMVQVGYRDFAPAYQDLNQGRLHVIGTGVPTLVPHHRAGTARLLFVTNRERAPQAPEVPTATEAGHPELTFEGTVGLFGPRDMPAALRERISADLRAVAADAAFRARLAGIGVAARTSTPAEHAAVVEEQRRKIAAIHQPAAKPKP
jgi:tripartite-type tricarboxylate transporter receptor subunit TctC